jgi:hypothetical protein
MLGCLGGAVIEFRINKQGTLEVNQRDVSPTVYLDHWALRKISADQTLMDRLTAALKSQNGTLALSWLNLSEFRRVTREEQVRNADNLLEAIQPQVFLLEVDFAVVISREDKLLAGGPPAPPHGDADFLREFITSARGLFMQVAQDRRRAQRFDELTDAIADRINVLRSKLATRQARKARESFIKSALLEFRPSITHSLSGLQIQRGTRFLLYELLRALLIDTKTKITRNYVTDLFHAVVPVAYCDFVLLDSHWKTKVGQVYKSLNKAGLSIPIAKVFSGKANEIHRFLCVLESS